MKKIYLFIAAVLATTSTHAQIISTAANSSVYLAPNSNFYFSGMTLTPSTAFTFGGQSLQKDTAVINTFNDPYVLRIYRFSDTTNFSGDIKISYLESELNGINESSLQLANYSGSWQALGTSTVNTVDNYILTTGINAVPLGEMMFTNGTVLPLEWGDITAMRQGSAVEIKWYTMQEWHVSHFDVERSMDGINWKKAITDIPANNKPYRSDYKQTDIPDQYGDLYYRIRQTDLDGRFSFSKTVSVSAQQADVPVYISPNPASDRFVISGKLSSEISSVALVNTGGSVIKVWKGNQNQFELSGISKGVYGLRVHLKNGNTINQLLLIR